MLRNESDLWKTGALAHSYSFFFSPQATLLLWSISVVVLGALVLILLKWKGREIHQELRTEEEENAADIYGEFRTW